VKQSGSERCFLLHWLLVQEADVGVQVVVQQLSYHLVAVVGGRSGAGRSTCEDLEAGYPQK